MRELIVNENDSDQRIDKFLKKYLSKAPHSFIHKMLRKKRIKLNNRKAKPEDTILEGDKIQFYIAEETLDKFIEEKEAVNISLPLPKIIYEDKNIILMNKPKGVLSHSANKNNSNNIVDSMISYLYRNGEYDPDEEKTFTPSICNRLDRNTSGIIIGAKNYEALKDINESIKNRDIKKYYKTMVKGKIDKDILLKGYLEKDEETNKVKIINQKTKEGKEVYTKIKVLNKNEEYSLLEIDLITGRSHQIRAHLLSIGHPVIGDIKYGDKGTNKKFKEKHGLENQFLHAYKIGFNGLVSLKYLNGKEFIANVPSILEQIEKDEFK
ncbi:MAG: RluA family pseudouridine synthase [Clostridiaceae bacterium]|nr:RluA family pseudouridine synthase [Clostridiaceae bacterium]MBW4860729.1 RluA family pseudouridine synthase [Clostridiaceae bacterium]MBW4869017.1 RluA family pseudouridine synthase [Clostridiaceae bacterium]